MVDGGAPRVCRCDECFSWGWRAGSRCRTSRHVFHRPLILEIDSAKRKCGDWREHVFADNAVGESGSPSPSSVVESAATPDKNPSSAANETAEETQDELALSARFEIVFDIGNTQPVASGQKPVAAEVNKRIVQSTFAVVAKLPAAMVKALSAAHGNFDRMVALDWLVAPASIWGLGKGGAVAMSGAPGPWDMACVPQTSRPLFCLVGATFAVLCVAAWAGSGYAVCRIFADSRRALLLRAVEKCTLDALAMPGGEASCVSYRPLRLQYCSFATVSAEKKLTPRGRNFDVFSS